MATGPTPEQLTTNHTSGYIDEVLAIIASVPRGHVTTYGDIAAAVGRAGPRQVGRVLAACGSSVPWWRVVHADGTPATCHAGTAPLRLADENVPLRSNGKVDFTGIRFQPASAVRSDVDHPPG